MGYLVMIEKAMNSHNPLSLSMLESYWGEQLYLQTAINKEIRCS